MLDKFTMRPSSTGNGRVWGEIETSNLISHTDLLKGYVALARANGEPDLAMVENLLLYMRINERA